MDNKTVFVLDHGPAMADSSKQMVDFDIFTKSRPQGFVPLAPVAKSVWSSCAEALCEYCRIVWDIFPDEKFLRFVVSGATPKTLNSWQPEEQTMSHLMRSLASVGPPSNKKSPSINSALVSAVDVLGKLTNKQDPENCENQGRVICITQLKNDNTKKALIDSFTEIVKTYNEKNNQDSLTPFCSLAKVELVIIHVKPFGVNHHITEQPLTPIPASSFIKVETHDVKTTRHGISIANRMLNLVQKHYDLSVTSITGIPMKEEQHANSSANYDVLLLHKRLPGTPLTEVFNGDGELTSTMLLKWCTPKININELHHCTGAARISPVDVNSRPSLCLTNFLLNGRSVLLEHWKKGVDGGTGTSVSGSKKMTHMISCRGSDIFLHALGICQTPFEDPPSITDGPGGKVTDYRINEFTEVVKEMQLLPLQAKLTKLKTGVLPINYSAAKLNRLTYCWPLVMSKTIVFNMKSTMDPLLTLIVKDSLSPDDVVNCQRSIYRLIEMEREGSSLPINNHQSSRPNIKSSKKDEQYRQMWEELEKLLQAHSTTSQPHKEVYECMLTCIGKTEPMELTASIGSNQAEVFESPESPPPLKKQKGNNDVVISSRSQKGGQSLLNMWSQRIDNINSQRHTEFYGRLTSDGSKAKLYPNIEQNENSNVAGNQERQGQRQHGHHRFHHHRGNSSGANSPNPGNRSGRNTPQGKTRDKKKNFNNAT